MKSDDYDIRITRRVEVELTPSQWQLFTDMDCEDAVDALNEAAGEALSKPTVKEAWATIFPVMDEWASWGASDTEPRAVFRTLTAKVFGEEEAYKW